MMEEMNRRVARTRAAARRPQQFFDMEVAARPKHTTSFEFRTSVLQCHVIVPAPLYNPEDTQDTWIRKGSVSERVFATNTSRLSCPAHGCSLAYPSRARPRSQFEALCADPMASVTAFRKANRIDITSAHQNI